MTNRATTECLRVSVITIIVFCLPIEEYTDHPRETVAMSIIGVCVEDDTKTFEGV
jgi:hypothetical protein